MGISAMRMTDEERRDYDDKITGIVHIITSDGDEARMLFASANLLAREMLPEEPANIRVFTAVKGAHLAFSMSELKTAMRLVEKERERLQQQQEQTRRREAALSGVDPTTERSYVASFMAARAYDMNYHREFYRKEDANTVTAPLKIEDIANDARLTAGDLDLIKPRGDQLSVTEISVALAEWSAQRRSERKEIAAARVKELADERDRDGINGRFKQVCERYFIEPAFAEAACRKFIWAVKRKLLGMPVKQAHMVIIVGPQDTGKTAFTNMLWQPLDELGSEVSLQDVLDTRQMDMPEYFVLFTDEMAFVERSEPAQLKTFLTGKAPGRRPMRTNISERVHINATLIGTANHSLERLVFDSSGMRRFVEIRPRPRAEIEPFWDEIVAFDWLSLWQSIDPAIADPLMSQFKDQLMQKQEAIRNLDNTEMWLRSFDPAEHRDHRRHETSTPECSEFFAVELYGIFRRWEDEFDPGFKGTSLQRWGREMRSLIENARVSGWKYRLVGNRTAYSVAQTAQSTNAVVPLVRKRRVI